MTQDELKKKAEEIYPCLHNTDFARFCQCDEVQGAIEDSLYDLQTEVARDSLEAAAQLCERVRCRNWDAKECASQIRSQLKQKYGVK